MPTIHARRRTARALGTTPIAEARVNLPTLQAALSEAVERAVRGEGFTLFTLNADHLVKLKESPAFRAAYERADLISADGFPIVWLANRSGAGATRACGSDMVEPLCQAAAERGLPVYFVGPGAQAQKAALDQLKTRFAGLPLAGAETPRLPADFTPETPGGFDAPALAERINASGARLVFLCLGAPKQEMLAAALAPLCPGVGFLCVGAALDFISAEVSRAPRWVQKINMEWAWRLTRDPKRLASRYARCAVRLAEVGAPALLSPPKRITSP